MNHVTAKASPARAGPSGASTSGLTLTSFAAVKRACTQGARLQAIESDNPRFDRQAREARARLIIQAHSDAIVLLGGYHLITGAFDPAAQAWLYWPRAAVIALHGDDTFTWRRVARYRVIAAAGLLTGVRRPAGAA